MGNGDRSHLRIDLALKRGTQNISEKEKKTTK